MWTPFTTWCTCAAASLPAASLQYGGRWQSAKKKGMQELIWFLHSFCFLIFFFFFEVSDVSWISKARILRHLPQKYWWKHNNNKCTESSLSYLSAVTKRFSFVGSSDANAVPLMLTYESNSVLHRFVSFSPPKLKILMFHELTAVDLLMVTSRASPTMAHSHRATAHG